MPEHPIESAPNRIKESAACDTCGRFGAVEIGGRLLCVDCYQGCGSCCSSEFGQEKPED